MDKTRLKQLGSGGSVAGDRIKIGLMLVLLVLIVGGYLYLQTREPESTNTEYIDRPKEEPRSTRIPGANPDPDALATVSEERPVIRETDPYEHLIGEAQKLVAGDMELLGVQNADWEALHENPKLFRARPLSLKGTLEWIEPFEGNLGTEFRGLVRDPENRSYFFTVVEGPGSGVLPGAVVKLEGFFFKLFTHIDSDNTMHKDLPYLVGKKLVASVYSMDPVVELDRSVFSAIRDSNPAEMSMIEDDVLYPVLSFIDNNDVETLHLGAQEAQHRELMVLAAEYRGLPIEYTGRLGQSWTELLGEGGENPVDLPRVHHALLYHAAEKLTYLISPEPLPDWLEIDDPVTVRGFFFKNYAWQSKSAGVVSGPLLVVYEFERWEMPEKIWSDAVIYTLLGLIVLMILGFLLAVFADRRSAKKFRQSYLERKRRKEQKQATQGEGAPSEEEGSGSPPEREEREAS